VDNPPPTKLLLTCGNTVLSTIHRPYYYDQPLIYLKRK